MGFRLIFLLAVLMPLTIAASDISQQGNSSSAKNVNAPLTHGEEEEETTQTEETEEASKEDSDEGDESDEDNSENSDEEGDDEDETEALRKEVASLKKRLQRALQNPNSTRCNARVINKKSQAASNGGVYECTNKRTIAPAYNRCSASSVWGGDAIGVSHGQGNLLSSPQAWTAGQDVAGEYWQIDIGEETVVLGVTTQNRGAMGAFGLSLYNHQRVTLYTVMHSADGQEWLDVDNGDPFVGNQQPGIKTNYFQTAVFTRYVRILAQEWVEHISMRAGLVVCSSPDEPASTLHHSVPHVFADQELFEEQGTQAAVSVYKKLKLKSHEELMDTRQILQHVPNAYGIRQESFGQQFWIAIEEACKLEEGCDPSQVRPLLDEYFAPRFDRLNKEFFEKLNPHMTITETRICDWSPNITAAEQAEAEKMKTQGYTVFPDVFDPDMMDRIQTAAATIKAAGLPAVYVFVYDEMWDLVCDLKRYAHHILEGDVLHKPAFWLWWVDPNKHGWRPHRDHPGQHRPNKFPNTITVWTAISDSLSHNGAMYILPADRDHYYKTQTHQGASTGSFPLPNSKEKICWDIDVTSIRALPVKKGSIVIWDQSVLHWGSKASQYSPHPRVSTAFEFQKADIPPLQEPTLSFDLEMNLERRLWLIKQMLYFYAFNFDVAQADYHIDHLYHAWYTCSKTKFPRHSSDSTFATKILDTPVSDDSNLQSQQAQLHLQQQQEELESKFKIKTIYGTDRIDLTPMHLRTPKSGSQSARRKKRRKRRRRKGTKPKRRRRRKGTTAGGAAAPGSGNDKFSNEGTKEEKPKNRRRRKKVKKKRRRKKRRRRRRKAGSYRDHHVTGRFTAEEVTALENEEARITAEAVRKVIDEYDVELHGVPSV